MHITIRFRINIINNISNELAFRDVKNVDFGIEFNAAVNKMKLKTEDLNTVKIRAKDFHSAARQFCRSTYTITDNTIK
jgi:hypothetical protein